MRTLWLIPVCMLMVAGLAGCQSGADPQGTATLMPVLTAWFTPRETESVFDDPKIEKMVKLAKERLAKRLDVPLEAIGTRQVTPVTWADASLGCPDAGIVYIPLETPGYRITLVSGGVAYFYHTDTIYSVVLCDAP